MSSLPIGWKLTLAKLLCHPTVGNIIAGFFGAHIPSRGGRLFVDTTYVQSQTIAGIFWRIHERSEALLIDKYLNRALDVIELGSSLGTISLQILHLQQHSRRLVCVEANPHLANMLKQTMASENTDRVFVLNRAISRGKEPFVLFEIDDSHLGSHLALQPSQSSIHVPTIGLHEILADFGIGDYVLVSDIEGAEAAVLLDEVDTLSRCQQLIIELHDVTLEGRFYSVEQLRSIILDELGFDQLARRNNVFVFGKRVGHQDSC